MDAARGAAGELPREPVAAGLGRRTLSLIYEAVLLAALLWAAALLFGLAESAVGVAHVRGMFQLYLVLVSGTYFVWQWAHGGQTLPLKTWRMRVVRRSGGAVNIRLAAVRYLLALVGSIALGAGYLWAIFDPDRQFLHDRLLGTRIVEC